MPTDNRFLDLNHLQTLALSTLTDPVLLMVVSGAHLYGFPSADSDVDLRGIHLLAVPALLGLDLPKQTVTRTWDDGGLEVDLVSHDLGKYMALLLNQNGNYLEHLFSPLVVVETPWADELRGLVRQGSITRHVYHAYAGYARDQWQMWRKQAEAGAARIKTLLYAYRVSLTGLHLLRTGEVNANLIELAPVYGFSHLLSLVEAKQQEKVALHLAVDEHNAALTLLQEQLHAAYTESHLPEKPANRPALNDFLVRVRLELGWGKGAAAWNG
ncbi:MAG: nucleotidyltransferase [Chloroflexi bacterium]|nr:MAG: nucleotidyltransferase [Chloroflexota bacterium]